MRESLECRRQTAVYNTVVDQCGILAVNKVMSPEAIFGKDMSIPEAFCWPSAAACLAFSAPWDAFSSACPFNSCPFFDACSADSLVASAAFCAFLFASSCSNRHRVVKTLILYAAGYHTVPFSLLQYKLSLFCWLQDLGIRYIWELIDKKPGWLH